MAAPFRIGGLEGVDGGRTVLPVAEGRLGGGGYGGGLVHVLDGNGDFMVPVVPAVISPHREGVYVVPVRVRRPFVVRCVPERQFTILIDGKVAAVRPRGAPPVYGSARTLRVTARVPGQHLVRAPVLSGGHALIPCYLRPLVHVGNGNCDSQGCGGNLSIRGLHRHLVFVLAGPSRTLKVRRTGKFQGAFFDDKVAAISPTWSPRNVSSLRVRGPEGVHRLGVVLTVGKGGVAHRVDRRRFVLIRHRHRDFMVPVVPAVISPHREGVYVVPVRVRRPFVVRCVPERQFTILIDGEVARVCTGQAPARYEGRRVLGVGGRVGGQHPLRSLVLGKR